MSIASSSDYAKYAAMWGLATSPSNLTTALSSVDGEVQKYCGRSFESVGQAASDRSFWGDDDSYLMIDDCTEVTSVTAINSNSSVDLDSTSWTVQPHNSAPITMLKLPAGRSWSSDTEYIVKAKWGWSTIPEAVKEACCILAAIRYAPMTHVSGANALIQSFSVINVDVKLGGSVDGSIKESKKRAYELLTPFRRLF